MEIVNTVLVGNVFDKIKEIDSKSVQCVVTSPPYWALRNYGEDNQLGLEETPESFVCNLVKVFDEVKRVLKDDGTLWLNLGDTYSAQRWTKKGMNTTPSQPMNGMKDDWRAIAPSKNSGLPDKNLVGIPWRVAFALQSSGWYLRQDIIWHKPNPMPESVKDRCTKSHEYIFLLTKSPNYKYNADDIKTGYAEGTKPGSQFGGKKGNSEKGMKAKLQSTPQGIFKIGDGSNRRSVWKIPVKPYKGAHFATFPEKIPELCIKAGSDKGDIILDPFFGSGTTGWVAQRLSRKWIGIELNPEYAKIANDRFKQQQLFY
jgi:DNA modification methylase